MKTISLKRLRALLAYDRFTGNLLWREHRANMKAGAIAGTYDSHGYRQIRIDGRLYLAHRLVWFYIKGTWPTFDLDHRDRNRRNNKIGNLRPATRTQNCSNAKMHPRNTSGIKGVGWCATAGKWRARISVKRRVIPLGYYARKKDAVAARTAAVAQYHGRFAGVQRHA
jgi:hypothetical protein